MAKKYVGVIEAAEYIGQKERFIRRLIAERRITFYKVGKFVSFDLADLDAFVKAGQVEAVTRLWVDVDSGQFVSCLLNAGRLHTSIVPDRESTRHTLSPLNVMRRRG